MQFTDVQVDRQPRSEWTTVTFRAEQGDSVVVRMRLESDQPRNRDTLVGSARAALLDAISATEGENPLPLSDVEVDASGRVYESAASTTSLEEEDDNPYQRPDEALPDDEEASSLLENPARERRRFGGG